MSSLDRVDRDILELWAVHGVPNDASTLATSAEIIQKALNEIDELKGIIDELLGGEER